MKNVIKKMSELFIFLKKKDWKKNFPFEELQKSSKRENTDYLKIVLSSNMYEWVPYIKKFLIFIKNFYKKNSTNTKYVRIQFYIEIKFSHSYQYSHLLPGTPIEKLDLEKILIMLNNFEEKYKQYFEDAYGMDSLKSVKLIALWR